MMNNPYIPYLATIDEIHVENDAGDVKTFTLVFDNDDDRRAFAYLPGQFAEVSVFGTGEAPFGIASSPTEDDYLLFTVKRAGKVTQALHDSEPGRKIGVRDR